MARNKTAQGGISLRRKVTAWLAAILLVTMLSTGIATMAGQWTVRSFDTLLADNAVCYTVQNALKDETQAFARYVRQPTSETKQAYTAGICSGNSPLPFRKVPSCENRETERPQAHRFPENNNILSAVIVRAKRRRF